MKTVKIPTPEEAAVKIQQGAAESIDVYRKLYGQYMELVAKGGHGSCCEMQSCLRWREELSLLELMELRLSPYYQRY